MSRIHLLTSCSELSFIVEPTKAMGSFTYSDHKGPAVNMIKKGIRDAGSTADFRILFEIFEILEIFDFFETFNFFKFLIFF